MLVNVSLYMLAPTETAYYVGRGKFAVPVRMGFAVLSSELTVDSETPQNRQLTTLFYTHAPLL